MHPDEPLRRVARVEVWGKVDEIMAFICLLPVSGSIISSCEVLHLNYFKFKYFFKV